MPWVGVAPKSGSIIGATPGRLKLCTVSRVVRVRVRVRVSDTVRREFGDVSDPGIGLGDSVCESEKILPDIRVGVVVRVRHPGG